VNRLTVLVGFREVCPYDGTPIFFPLTPGTFEVTGGCDLCHRWFRAQYEPAGAGPVPLQWHEDARAAITALVEICRRLRDELNLVMLSEISPPKSTSGAEDG
jgi:hypothetical protein